MGVPITMMSGFEEGRRRRIDEPGRAVAHVAAFVCPGLERLGRGVGFPLAVIAATVDPRRHAAHLTRVQHAAWSTCDGAARPIVADAGADLALDFAYEQLQFDPRWLGGARLPPGVCLHRGSLTVALPPGASAGDLSEVLWGGLSDLAYERLARRPDRVRHRFATGRPVVVAPRYAMTAGGGTRRFAPVDDLFRFRSGDLARIVDCLALAAGSLVLACGIDRIDVIGGEELQDA